MRAKGRTVHGNGGKLLPFDFAFSLKCSALALTISVKRLSRFAQRVCNERKMEEARACAKMSRHGNRGDCLRVNVE